MQMKSVRKAQFAGLNDKRFSFHDGIVPIPFGHFLLEKAREEKHRNELLRLIQKKYLSF